MQDKEEDSSKNQSGKDRPKIEAPGKLIDNIEPPKKDKGNGYGGGNGITDYSKSGVFPEILL